jgi:hypothetical protein
MVWTTCWYDVVYKIKLKTEELSTNHLQFYNSIAEIVSSVFGGKKKEVVKVNDMDPDSAVNALNGLFNLAGNH